MAVTPVNAGNVRRRTRSFASNFLNPSLNRLLKTFFEIHGQLNKNVDLLVVELDNTGTTDQVVADAACKLYFLGFKGGSVGGDYRAADHASSANSPTTTIPIAVSEQIAVVFPAGKAMANGLTVDFSAANTGIGIAIIGAA